MSNNKTYKIRLNGIDCPEKNQAFGTKAKQFTSDLCFSKNVTTKITDKDKYGRYIGDITLPNGTSVNQEIVKNGYAWHYKQYSNDQILADLENSAKKMKIGLWSDPQPIPPWEFRNGPAKVNNSKIETQNSEYWVNSSSMVRHNSSCRWYKNTKNGYLTNKKDGRACGICGG